MYSDVVTIFNQVGDTWYGTVIKNCNLVTDKAKIVARYGDNSQDRCSLHIKYKTVGDNFVINNKKYIKPKLYMKSEYFDDIITFDGGQNATVIYAGEYESLVIDDDDYTEGFFNYLNKTYDDVYVVTSVSRYVAIPHFEVTAK